VGRRHERPGSDDAADLGRARCRLWLAIGALAIGALPWKAPAANLLGLAYGLAVAAGAPGLWRGARWAWRLGLATCLLGLAAAVVAVSGLVASWAYLRAVYGAFGAGASIASLLIAGMVFQLLGLYPAVRLRALLRREVREIVRGGRLAVAAAVALVLLPVATGAAVQARFALDPLPRLPDQALGQALAVVRALAEGTPPPAAPHLAGLHPGAGPVLATLWQEGERVARGQGAGRDLAGAAAAAGRALRTALVAAGRPPVGQIRMDRVVAQGPVLRWPPVAFSLGLDPGLDGLAAGERVAFLPDDLLRAGVAGSAAPLDQLDELRAGIDVGWMEARLAEVGPGGPLRRLRTEAWVEVGVGWRRLHRGNVIGSGPLSARRAAILAGDFILGQMESDGRFRYRYQPYDGTGAGPGEYSLPRHAGTAYALTLLFAHTGETRFRDGAAASLQWLGRQVGAHCGLGRACLVEPGGDGRAPLGHAALTAIALLTYQDHTGDRRYATMARQLLEFLLSMQRPDGELHHLYDVTDGRAVDSPPGMFASEQAALALVLGQRIFEDGRMLGAAERALDFLTLRKHDHFLGRFVYGADHWTCLAAEAATPRLAHLHYLEFCRGYARFMGRLQYPADEGPARDFAGHYGFGYLLVPQAPATAGFAEALLSTVALAEHHRRPDRALKDQARAALSALARDQLRPENSYLVRSPARALGGFRRSLVEPEIRIDFVQHAASALVRGPALGLEDL
jgi:hypothetical protein